MLLAATHPRTAATCGSDPVVLAATLGSIAVNQIYFRAPRRYGQSRVAESTGHRSTAACSPGSRASKSR